MHKIMPVRGVKPCIVITTGDPEGIGQEVTKKALIDPRIKALADFIIINPDDKTGFDAVEKAALILKRRTMPYALVTAPVNKSAINKSGIPFKGHTEFLASITRAKKFAMMFCAGKLRITLVTRHIALKDVPKLLAAGKILDAIILTGWALKKYFRIHSPRIGVCGLNPHCGEGGLMGKEEKKIIMPAVESARQRFSCVQGPLPADTAFYMAYKGKLDAVVAMYHDQALCPFKMVAFEKGVNITLGLPFVRTSPVHGTAYDIAGKGIANPGSMKEAIKLAIDMSMMQGSVATAPYGDSQ